MSKTTKQKATSKPVKRREELRRTVPKPSRDLKSLLLKPGVAGALTVGVAFAVIASMFVIWSREQIKVDVDQIMTETRLVRRSFTEVDEGRTEAAKREARERARTFTHLTAIT